MLDQTEAVSTEVSPKAQRRFFSAQDRRRILQEADACTKTGEIGALLRREGIYSSYLSSWRQTAERALAPKKRGPKVDARDRKIVELERENTKLKAQVHRAELVVDIQKKVFTILGISPQNNDEKP